MPYYRRFHYRIEAKEVNNLCSGVLIHLINRMCYKWSLSGKLWSTGVYVWTKNLVGTAWWFKYLDEFCLCCQSMNVCHWPKRVLLIDWLHQWPKANCYRHVDESQRRKAREYCLIHNYYWNQRHRSLWMI